MSSIWGTAEGLPANEVRAIAERPAGGFWVATTGGLVRWTGTALEAIVTPPGFERARDIVAMSADGRGTLWMIPSQGQPLCLRAERFEECLRSDDRVRDDAPLVALDSDHTNAVWFATRDLIYRFADNSLSWTSSFPRKSTGPVKTIFAARDGRLFIGAENGLFVRTNDGQIGPHTLPQLSETDGSVLSLARGRGDALLIGGVGVVAVDSSAGTRQAPVPEGMARARFTSVLEGRDGTIWAGGSEGLLRWRVDESPPVRVFTRREEGLPDPHVMALLEDQAGNLWVGTRRAGLVRFTDPPPLSTIRPYAVVGLVLVAIVVLVRRRAYRRVVSKGSENWRVRPPA